MVRFSFTDVQWGGAEGHAALGHSPTSLPGLSSSLLLSVSIHWPLSGPLQLVSALPVPLPHLHGPESTAPAVLRVRP